MTTITAAEKNAELYKSVFFQSPREAQLAVKRTWEAISNVQPFLGLPEFLNMVQTSDLAGISMDEFKTLATNAIAFLKSEQADTAFWLSTVGEGRNAAQPEYVLFRAIKRNLDYAALDAQDVFFAEAGLK